MTIRDSVRAAGRSQSRWLRALRSWPWMTVAALGLVAAAWGVTKGGGRVWQRFQAYRAGRFVADAQRAAGRGDFRAAHLAYSSALEFQPGNFALRIGAADALLRSPSGSEGVRAWRTLVQERGESDSALPITYATRLISLGMFPELARLAVEQLSATNRNRGLWLNLGAEACRLSGCVPGAEEASGIRDPRFRLALRGYALAVNGEPSRARDELANLNPAPLPEAVALLAARAWLQLGDKSQARLVLFRSDHVYSPAELQAVEVLLGPSDSATASAAVTALFGSRASLPEREWRLGFFVMLGGSAASARAAERLVDLLGESEAALSPSALTALWIYSGLARHGDSELHWRERLASRVGTTLPPIGETQMSVRLFRVLVDRVPMPMELVCTLMSLVRREEGTGAEQSFGVKTQNMR